MTGTADALIAAAEAAADELQAMDAQVAELTAENAALRAQLAGGPSVTFGLNVGPEVWAAGQSAIDSHRAMCGGGPMSNVRVFFPSGAAPKWTSKPFGLLRGDDRPWVSCKTLTEATLRAFVQTIPARFQLPGKPIRLTYRHEGEADILRSSDPAAGITDYLNTYAMIVRVLGDEPNGKWFEPWKILLRYTQAESSRAGEKGSWPQFVGDQQVPVGMDCYWQGWDLGYWPADFMFAPLLDIAAKTGLRIAVPELGGVTVYRKPSGGLGRNDADGSKRAAAIADAVTYLKTTKVESCNWWCGTGSQGDHHLDNYPSNVAAWRGAMTGGSA